MSIFSALYTLLIGPLELFFEVLFVAANRTIENPGLSIIFLSLAMNFLVLPLYRRADAMQAEERDTEEKLGGWVKHIKKTFKGDERYMMLQTYYRQNHYKPTDALKGSVSLLLEIPFFMAAYNFLSSLPLLDGVSFGPIRDLAAPDAMFTVAGFTVNVLPILMTAINLISSAIYTKGLPTKSKVQLYVMAGLFLVLLYDSPSGLVFYWTLNNLFSLFKNIFYKLRNPKFVFSILSSVSGVLLSVYVLFFWQRDMQTRLMNALLLLVLQLPALLYCLSGLKKEKKPVEITARDTSVFRLGTVFITLLTGLLIPSAVIHSSPEEFINTAALTGPLVYVWHTALMAAGTFIVWVGIFYMLASPAGKKIMGCAIWLLSGMAAVNYMFFGKDYGNLSPNLTFDSTPSPSVKMQWFNVLVLLAVSALLFVLWNRKKDVVRMVLLSAGIAVIVMSSVNIVSVHSAASDKINQLKVQNTNNATIPLSKNGQNVMVIMMDRAIGTYVPYLMNEKPELKEQFAGFTYYPNTISYGGYTNFGSPALYGGYDYMPVEINKRDTESLCSKQNEALKVMPVVFDHAGFETTVCDPTYAGYQWIPDLSIYDEYPNIRKFITMGKYMDHAESSNLSGEERLNRSFFCYSLFKSAPVFAQPSIYWNGEYNEAHVDVIQTMDGLYHSKGFRESFLESYTVLQNLPEMTCVSDSDQNTFMMISNDTTHEPMLLEEPSYEPAKIVDNEAYTLAHMDRYTVDGLHLKMNDKEHVIHYHSNMAGLLQLGKWFDYMREQGVYDNTRIIIVADHGRETRQRDDMIFRKDGTTIDAMAYNPLFMVKDFNSREFTTDTGFMTNADVPALAMEGLISNPTNPFTGHPINTVPKTQGEQYIITSNEWSTEINNGNTFLPSQWISVHDNIFDGNNWSVVH